VDISFEDDVTVILLLVVSFMTLPLSGEFYLYLLMKKGVGLAA
jgi:hypothetical protein